MQALIIRFQNKYLFINCGIRKPPSVLQMSIASLPDSNTYKDHMNLLDWDKFEMQISEILKFKWNLKDNERDWEEYLNITLLFWNIILSMCRLQLELLEGIFKKFLMLNIEENKVELIWDISLN